MNRIRTLLTMMLLVPGAMALATSPAAQLDTLLEQARSEDYAVPAARQILQAQQGFSQWLAADDRTGAAQHIEVPGFEAVPLRQPGIVVLNEKADVRHGRGLFAARGEGGTPLMIQAPHQYYDLRTGTIARMLFLESNAVAAAWNTTHRYHDDDTDLLHIPDSYLHALSRAFIDVHPGGRILQVHGFSSSNRESRAGRSARAILSDGSRYPPAALSRLADCLSHRLGIRALLYPRDVRELGATTNTLGADLRRRGFDGFVHLELDADLRKQLVADTDTRRRLMQCVTETAP